MLCMSYYILHISQLYKPQKSSNTEAPEADIYSS